MLSVISVFIITLFTIFCIYLKHVYSFWERKGVPHVPPIFPYGNIKGIGKTIHSCELITSLYNRLKGKGKLFGIYGYFNPVAIATDLDLIKSVLIRDFSYFENRGMYYNEKDDPLSAHLFSLEGSKWRKLRAKLTPTFTTGKVKMMFSAVVQIAKQMKLTVENNMTMHMDDVDVEIEDLLARYTTDVIGACAFGFECNSLKNPETEFRRMGRKVFTEPISLVKFVFISGMPKVARFLGCKLTSEDVESFFMGIIRDTVLYREINGIKRYDFMDLLIQLKNAKSDETIESITMNELSAQSYVFFLGGFETSSTTVTFALYELAKNLDMQNRAREEIKTVLEQHNGVFSYEAMTDMLYVNQILQGK